jgi:hypothetical protein
MKPRPVRPNIYLPVVRFGVADSDWFSVLLISCVGYLAPVPFGLTVLYVPLQMWTWLIATAGSIAFFNYIRIGRKPYWLQHKVKALFLPQRQHRALPNGRNRGFHRPWITEAQADAGFAPYDRSPPVQTQSSVSLLLEHNQHIQKASEESWNELLPTTN